MKIYFVEKTCQHRPVPGKPAIYLERGTQYQAADNEPALEFGTLIATEEAVKEPVELQTPVKPVPAVVADIRSRRDITDELDKLNVVYSKRASIPNLEALLVDAKKMRLAETQ